MDPCISKLLCPPKSCAAVPGGAPNCPKFSSNGVFGCVPGCDCGIWSPNPPASMVGRLSRSKSSMLKMLERSSRLPFMVAIVSIFSGACDHIWSAGAFMLVFCVVYERTQASCAAGVQSARAQRFRGANAHSSQLGSRSWSFVEAASGRAVPRGVQYAVLPRFVVVSGGGRSSSSRAGCRSQQRRAELGSSSLQAEINYGEGRHRDTKGGRRAHEQYGENHGRYRDSDRTGQTFASRARRMAVGREGPMEDGRWKCKCKCK